jgi:hypothetical protein
VLYGQLESGERVGSWIACGFVGCALVEIQASLKDLHMAGRFFTSTTVTRQFLLSPYTNSSAYCASATLLRPTITEARQETNKPNDHSPQDDHKLAVDQE